MVTEDSAVERNEVRDETREEIREIEPKECEKKERGTKVNRQTADKGSVKAEHAAVTEHGADTAHGANAKDASGAVGEVADAVGEKAAKKAKSERTAVGEVAVEARNLSYRYQDGSHPIRNLSFRVCFGEMVFLTGESGSGKTSTLNLILGMDRPSGGDLVVLGEDMYRVKTRGIKSLRRNIGTVFQSFRLQKDRTALQNVALPLRFLGGGKIKERALQALEQVGLRGLENKKVMNLSQGERQRVAIARAIVGGAKFILADEPTGNLDAENSRAVLDILNELAQAGAAVLVTTHALHLIPEYPQSRQYALQDGTAEEVIR